MQSTNQSSVNVVSYVNYNYISIMLAAFLYYANGHEIIYMARVYYSVKIAERAQWYQACPGRKCMEERVLSKGISLPRQLPYIGHKG